jgi:hypothetical protein
MRTFTVSLIALSAMFFWANPAQAARQVRVFEANVSAQTEPSVQAQSALRTVLVRATGERNAANDPALANILSQAQSYVIGTRPATGGAVTLFFDGAALERDINAAGRTVWGVERPLVLIVLTGGPASGAFESRRQVESTMDAAGNRRGQPINVVRPEVVGLPNVGDIPANAALAAAQRARADAVLVGYGDSVPDGGPWRWVLTAPGVSETWNGTPEEGVNGAADVFARNAAVFAAQGIRRGGRDHQCFRRRAQRAARGSRGHCRGVQRGDSRRHGFPAGVAGFECALRAHRPESRRRAGVSTASLSRPDAAAPAQFHLPGAHCAHLADHRRAVFR